MSFTAKTCSLLLCENALLEIPYQAFNQLHLKQ